MRRCVRAFLCVVFLLASTLDSGLAGAEPLEVRVLLTVVDGSQPVPRTLRHYENTAVTNVAWTDVATVHDFAFERSTSFARLFEEMSFGELSISGDTLQITLPYPAGDYTWEEWIALADSEALNQGFDPASYDRQLYILPYLPRELLRRDLPAATRAGAPSSATSSWVVSSTSSVTPSACDTPPSVSRTGRPIPTGTGATA